MKSPGAVLQHCPLKLKFPGLDKTPQGVCFFFNEAHMNVIYPSKEFLKGNLTKGGVHETDLF